jgi:hypothetical protein
LKEFFICGDKSIEIFLYFKLEKKVAKILEKFQNHKIERKNPMLQF